jgi:hypothetical protein
MYRDCVIGLPNGILVYILLSDVHVKMKHSRLDRMERHRHAGSSSVILQYFFHLQNGALPSTTVLRPLPVLYIREMSFDTFN